MDYLLDTNILIEWFSEGPSQSFIQEKIIEEDADLQTSWICAAEFLVKARSEEKRALIEILESKALILKELSGIQSLELVAQCCEKTQLLLPDSIILATTKVEKAILITRDAVLAKKGRRFYPHILMPE